MVAQLLERQIPIYDILGKKMGKNAEEVADMVSRGRCPSGLLRRHERQARRRRREDGRQLQGAVDNMGAALGRLGAARWSPRSVVSPLVGYGDGRDRWRYAEGEGVLQGLRCEGVRRVGAEGYRFR
ncbi:hypothetical protein GS918_28215 [Rhodococcus hoagii]|nr:hypothetical protein [Prescottella equi]